MQEMGEIRGNSIHPADTAEVSGSICIQLANDIKVFPDAISLIWIYNLSLTLKNYNARVLKSNQDIICLHVSRLKSRSAVLSLHPGI